jgi:hypothetical protein
MSTFFIAIYDWLGHSLFSSDLNTFLCGGDINEEVQNAPCLFIPIGIVMVVITLLVILWFYIVPHAGFHTRIHWIITWVLTGIVNMFVGLGMVTYYARHAAEDLVPENGFTSGDCWGFAFDNLFLCLILFFLLSVIFMWRNGDCKMIPFGIITKK